MTIKEIVSNLEEEMGKAYGEYIHIRQSLNDYAGMTFSESSPEYPIAVQMVERAQELYLRLWPAYNFIHTNHQPMLNKVETHNRFIEALNTPEPTPLERH